MMVKEITGFKVERALHVHNTSWQIIDVREIEELSQGQIPESLHIPLQQLPSALSQLRLDKKYVIVCRSGQRSMAATSYLVQNGFDALNMKGGLLEWEGELVF